VPDCLSPTMQPLAKDRRGGYAGSMFEGLSKHEIIGWVICLAVALGFTLSGGAYLAASLMSADMSDALPHQSSSQNFRK
jgi:hypothetical protein